MTPEQMRAAVKLAQELCGTEYPSRDAQRAVRDALEQAVRERDAALDLLRCLEPAIATSVAHTWTPEQIRAFREAASE